MKKILFLFVFLCAAFPLNAWVFLDSVEKDGSGWLLPKMLSGQTVRVCVDVLEPSQNGKPVLYTGPQQDAYYAMSAQIVYSAYQSWFDNAWNQIRHSGRKKEFKDILAVLPKKPPIQFINISPSAKVYKSCRDYAPEEVDLKVQATLYKPKSPSNRTTVAFELLPDNTGLTNVKDPAPSSSLAMALRETGYTLGLADQNALKKGLASPVYTCAAAQEGKTVAVGESPVLGCDEAEGLINLVDFFSRSPSQRVQSGWLGFCPNRPVVYSQGVGVAIDAQQAQAQQEFVAQGRQDPAPLAAELAAARDNAARYQRVKKAAQDKQKEGLRRDVAQAISAARQTQK